MTAIAEPRNGHELPFLPLAQSASPTEDWLALFGDQLVPAEQLRVLRAQAGETIAVQDAEEFAAAMGGAELAEERRIAVFDRTADRLDRIQDRALELADKDAERALRTKTQKVQRDLRSEEVDAGAARARSEARVEKAIADRAHADELAALDARALLTDLTNPVSALATLFRTRKLALRLTAAPTVIAVLIGAFNVGGTLGPLFGLSWLDPLRWLLYGFEPLATLPLVAILLLHAADPEQAVSTFKDLRKRKYFRIEATLVAVSIVLNVVPHLYTGDVTLALIWMWVPITIVITLWLLPQLVHNFNQRLRFAQAEAELGAPAGNLSPAEARLVRHMRLIRAASEQDEILGTVGEDGIPSTRATERTLRAVQGKASVPEATRVNTALRVLQGIDE